MKLIDIDKALNQDSTNKIFAVRNAERIAKLTITIENLYDCLDWAAFELQNELKKASFPEDPASITLEKVKQFREMTNEVTKNIYNYVGKKDTERLVLSADNLWQKICFWSKL